MIAEICALAIVAALSFFILSELKWRGAPVLVILCAVGIISVAEPHALKISGVLHDLADSSGITDSLSAVLKVVGIGYLAGISSDVCSELGAARVGNAVTLIARLEIIAVAAPFFMGILDMGRELIS